MKRYLHVELDEKTDTCSDCPYCVHDDYYSMSTDSGYDCFHPDSKVRRIVDDGALRGTQQFPSIPTNCPLPRQQDHERWLKVGSCHDVDDFYKE